MSEQQIIQKLIASKANVNSKNLRTGEIDPQDMNKISEACGLISSYNFHIITRKNTIQAIEVEARRLKNRDQLDLLIIDYLQLVKNAGKFNSREQEVADISRTLKLLSLDLKIPIIALCQLNRNASRLQPTLADIRESGAVEQDADNVIFIYYENESDREEGLVTIDLQKQRAGNIGAIKVKFQKQFSRFVNLMKKQW
jgi:replicative DNA helicase